MKKILLIITLFIASNIGKTQCVLNGGFEDTYIDKWGNVLPKNWIPNFWGMILDTTAPSKTAKGNYAYVIFNRDDGDNTHERRAGRIQNRFKLTCLPTSFSAYIKYQVFTSNEKFLLRVVLFNHNTTRNGIDTIAIGYIEPIQSERITVWTKFKAPIEYRKFEQPDSAEITIWASQPNSYSKTTALAVDEVNFEDIVQALSAKDMTNQQRVVDVYPNPATSSVLVKINVPKAKKYFLTVYDLLGRDVINKSHAGENNPEIELNTSPLSPGTYLLKVVSDDGTVNATHKILIVKP